MSVPDFVEMRCPNCAVTIRLYAKKHVWRRVWNCDMCDHSIVMSSANWLLEGGFFIERGPDQKDPDYYAVADDPAELLAMQLRMAQRNIDKKRKK